MIKNQRPYQLFYSKTHNSALSLAAAFCLKTAGICISALPAADGRTDISIIIPAYNCEKYIEKCIDSVLAQETKYTVEIIAVNDNSSDGTAEKLAEYECIKVIDLKDGGSAAKARNAGLMHSRGKYIMFVDSDDMLAQGAVDLLMKKAAEVSADVVQGGWQYMTEDGDLGDFQQYTEAVYCKKHTADRFDLPGMPWGKIYKRELFEEIRFPDNYTCFEDSIIHFLVFRKAKTVASIKENVYLWRKNPNGITSSSQNNARAAQSYWIVEELLERDKALGLIHDEMFEMCLTGQLSNFCYANTAKLAEITSIFALCCDLYEKHSTACRHMPYAVRLGAKALRRKNFILWVRQGKLYQLIR